MLNKVKKVKGNNKKVEWS